LPPDNFADLFGNHIPIKVSFMSRFWCGGLLLLLLSIIPHLCRPSSSSYHAHIPCTRDPKHGFFNLVSDFLSDLYGLFGEGSVCRLIDPGIGLGGVEFGVSEGFKVTGCWLLV